MFSSAASSSVASRDDEKHGSATPATTANGSSDSGLRIRALAGRDDLLRSLNTTTEHRLAELETERQELIDELDQFTERFFRPLNQSRDAAWLDRYQQLLSSDDEEVVYNGSNRHGETFHNELEGILDDPATINRADRLDITDANYENPGSDSEFRESDLTNLEVSEDDDSTPLLFDINFALVDRSRLLQTVTGRGGIDTNIFGFNTGIDPDESLIADLFRLVINFVLICFAILALIFFEIDFFPAADLYAKIASNASYEFCLPSWSNVAIGMFDLDRACISRLPYEAL